MMIAAATPFGPLLMLFFAVPLGIIGSIYGAECASSLRRRAWRQKPH